MIIEVNNDIIKKIGHIADKFNTEAYLVGGYVRDLLLQKDTSRIDIDIMVIGDAVGFAEKAASGLNTKLDAVYKKFGTALLNTGADKIEFASARKESYNKDSRKPEVEFSDLKDDLSRRDFTINALAVSINKENFGELVDFFNGVDDLNSQIIRTPLDPEKTFTDDPLRILRAIRFASLLQFNIEPETFEAIKRMKDRLNDNIVSQERITNEFLLILTSPKPSIGLDLLYKTGIMDIIFPEISRLAGVDQRKDFHHKDVFYHTLKVIDNIAPKTDNVWLRFAALVHDIAKPPTKKFVEGIGWTFHGHEELGARMMKKIFMKLKLPLQQLPYVEKLVRLHLRPIPLAKEEVTDSAVRRLAADAGEELEDLLKLCRADITSKDPKKVNKFMRNYEIVEKKIMEVQEKDMLRNFQSPVRGEEIMEICNIPPSKAVGIIKHRIEEAILEGEIPNEYEAAKEYLYKIKDEVLNQNQNQNQKPSSK